MYTNTASANRRKAYIERQNERIEKANANTDRSIKALSGRIDETQRERDGTYDDSVDAKLAKEITSLKRQMAARERARKLLTTLSGPQTFQTRSDALKRVAETTTVWWVLTGQVGLDFTRTIYPRKEDADKRREAIVAANREPSEANKPIEKKIAVLRRRLFTRKQQLMGSGDKARKAELQEEIEALQTEIAAREAELQPVTKVYPPRRFAKKADAERYIVTAQERSEEAKAQAGAKKEAGGT